MAYFHEFPNGNMYLYGLLQEICCFYNGNSSKFENMDLYAPTPGTRQYVLKLLPKEEAALKSQVSKEVVSKLRGSHWRSCCSKTMCSQLYSSHTEIYFPPISRLLTHRPSSSMSSETHTVWDTDEVCGLGPDSGWHMNVGITNGRKWSLPTTHGPPADMLNPLATIEWETCWELQAPGRIYDGAIRSVLQNGKLYVGMAGMVLEFSDDLAAWKVLPPPPVTHYGLSSYHSHLVLVGGRLNGNTSNKLWMYDNDTWHCSLPPMLTCRDDPAVVNTGTPEYLVVAAGGNAAKVVDVLVGRQWVSCAAPWVATVCAIAGASVHNGNIYFTGSFFLAYCQLGSLVKACVQPDGVSDTKGIWDLVPVPVGMEYRSRMGIVAYGKFLICYNRYGHLYVLCSVP